MGSREKAQEVKHAFIIIPKIKGIGSNLCQKLEITSIYYFSRGGILMRSYVYIKIKF